MLEGKAFESKELRETELGSECLLCLETTLISSSKCASSAQQLLSRILLGWSTVSLWVIFQDIFLQWSERVNKTWDRISISISELRSLSLALLHYSTQVIILFVIWCIGCWSRWGSGFQRLSLYLFYYNTFYTHILRTHVRSPTMSSVTLNYKLGNSEDPLQRWL